MVEIWRWPKASLSASLIACIDTPRRLAISRSTLHHGAQAALLGLRDHFAQVRARRAGCSARRVDQIGDIVGVAAHQRVLELRAADARADLHVLHRLEVDGNDAGNRRSTLPAGASMTAVTSDLRASRGFSVIFRWPALGVGLRALTPTTGDDASTLRIVADGVGDDVLQALHLGEGDLGSGLHHGRDRARCPAGAGSLSARSCRGRW